MTAFGVLLTALIAMVCGFVGAHFYFTFVAKDDVRAESLDVASNLVKATSEPVVRAIQETVSKLDEFEKDILDVIDTVDSFQDDLDKTNTRVNSHYRWSLGIWNDIAGAKESFAHPIPDEMQEVLHEEVVDIPEHVSAMGPQDNAS